MVLAVGGIYACQALDPVSSIGPCAAAGLLTGVSTYFFARLFQGEEDRLSPEGLLFLGAALTLALGDLTVLNVSVGRTLLCALLACTAYGQGPMTGVTAGLGLGLVTDLTVGTGGLFTAAYGMAGLLAARCRRRCTAAMAFFLGALAAMLTSREALAMTLLLETIAGALLFLAIPRRIFGGKRVRQEAAPAEAEAAQGKTLRTRLDRAAEAMRALYDSMNRAAPPQEENPAVIFDRAAEKVCRSCALCQLCWQKEYTSTFNALNDATPFLLERGKAPRPRISPPILPTAASTSPSFCRPSTASLPPFCCASSTAASWRRPAAAPRGSTPRCPTCSPPPQSAPPGPPRPLTQWPAAPSARRCGPRRGSSSAGTPWKLSARTEEHGA